jgi:peptide/nickel transport system permease protein
MASIWTYARRDPLSAFAVASLLLLTLLGAVGPLFPIGDPDLIEVGPRLSKPTLTLPLGTDDLGRSMLPRVVQAIHVTLVLAATAVAVTACAGSFVGMAAAYAGGVADMLVVRLADVLFSFPALLLAILITAILGPGSVPAMAAIVFVTLPLFIRVVRSVTLRTVTRGYVIAAEVSGASAWRILFVHILPNVAGAIIVQLTYAVSVGMLVESALSFLGLGVQPPQASLGSLLREGVVYVRVAPWMVLPAAVVLTTAILSINLIGDALRDALEPLVGRALR